MLLQPSLEKLWSGALGAVWSGQYVHVSSITGVLRELSGIGNRHLAPEGADFTDIVGRWFDKREHRDIERAVYEIERAAYEEEQYNSEASATATANGMLEMLGKEKQSLVQREDQRRLKMKTKRQNKKRMLRVVGTPDEQN